MALLREALAAPPLRERKVVAAVFGNLNVYALPSPGAAALALVGMLFRRARRN